MKFLRKFNESIDRKYELIEEIEDCLVLLTDDYQK